MHDLNSDLYFDLIVIFLNPGPSFLLFKSHKDIFSSLAVCCYCSSQLLQTEFYSPLYKGR
jgi:hypothetical protein